MHPIRFVVIGLNGYSLIHLEAIQWLAKQNLAHLSGVIALETDRVKQPQLFKALKSQRVTFYENISTFLEKYADTANVLTVPLGIHQHVPVSVAAMQAGLDVYCEKPVAATIQEVDHLIQTQQKTARKIVIGFQHIYSRSIKNLKARICDGRLGKVRSLRLIHGWPRSKRYYTRNDWAGRLRLGKLWVLDSPANNAMAHYLLNLLYLSSTHPGQTAVPINIRAELYRANLIEGADMTQIKCTTLENTQAWVIFTHCNSLNHLPFMQIECENGR
ncbi:MAG: Gfo/Idh/MocA family protein, partial [bacterium]